jgi:ferritin
MKIIKILSEQISEEICDAKKYAKMALEYKDEYPDLSRDLYSLSMQEMDHRTILHNRVTEMIKRYREEHGEPPADMLAVYDYLHKQQIEKALEVKSLQAMYKES